WVLVKYQSQCSCKRRNLCGLVGMSTMSHTCSRLNF
ncbi:hypothetical protein VN97_g9517, partial [Penicillium thymicola]